MKDKPERERQIQHALITCGTEKKGQKRAHKYDAYRPVLPEGVGRVRRLYEIYQKVQL